MKPFVVRPTRVFLFLFSLVILTAAIPAAVAQTATLSPTSRAFGSVGVGSPSATRTFTLRNTATTALSVSSISTSGDFSQTNTCKSSVAARGNCVITVTFTPTATGARTGTLTVVDGAGTQTGSLQGTGVAPLTANPASRSFGNTALGTTSASKTFTLTNHTSAALPVTITPSAGFVETDTCAGSVPASGTCTINAAFSPTTATAQTGSITVSYSGFGSPLSLSVTGTGIAPVTISPASLAFSTTLRVGTPSNAKTVTIRNRATVALNIQSIVASPASYAQTNTCGTSVPASGTCTVTVIFTPATAGSIPGTLTISDSALGSPQIVSMTGGGAVNNLRSIAITPANSSVAKGGQLQFKATGTYGNGTTGDVTTAAVWTSNSAAVTIGSNTGLAIGVTTGGTATITATVTGTNTASGSVASTTSVTVSSAALASIALSPATASIAPGGTQQYTAMGTYTDTTSAPLAASTLTFGSDNVGVATISTSGMATGINGGTANIRAAFGTITSPTVPLTVTGPTLQSITIAPANPSIQKGSTQQFTATGNYSDGTHPDLTTQVTWSAAPAANATISNAAGSQGLATALAVGPITVSASWGGATVQASVPATVTPPPLTSISVCLGASPCSTSTAPVGVTLGLNGTQQLTAVGTYADNTTQDLTNTVAWTSFNTSLVTVSPTGMATVIGLQSSSTAVAVYATSGTITTSQNSNTVFISADPSIAITCPSPTIDMKLLLVNNSAAGYADVAGIQQILDFVGTPYTVMEYSAVTPSVLSDGACHGFYQGIIMAFGNDIYGSNSSLYTTLNKYETTFKVRQINWYFNPTPDYGFNYAATTVPASTTSSYSANFTTAAASVFPNINTLTPLSISGAFIYLSPPYTPASGTVTPLLTDAGGNVLSAIYAPGNGPEILSQTFDSSQYLTHNLVLAYGLLNWVTRGVFLGDYHVYASAQVDDFFINDSEWIPSTTCLTNLVAKDRTAPDASNLPVFRITSNDMTQLVAWQNSVQNDLSGLFQPFKLTIAFNGVGTVGNGDWTGLTAPIISASASGGVASFVAQAFSGQVGQTATVAGTTNGMDGTYVITSVTPSASFTPPRTTFTVAFAGGNKTSTSQTAATVSVPDDLVANLASYEAAFHWISHTYNHPSTLNGLCQSTPTGTNPDGSKCSDLANGGNPTDDIDLEILTNRWVASDPNALPAWPALDSDSSDTAGLKQLHFTDFNSENIVTPGVTGLNDPNVPGYLYTDGIRFAVSDTSVIGQPNNGPNPSPNVGIVSMFNGVPTGIYEVPRYPNDIFYNAATWADDTAEFQCIYQNYVPPYVTPVPAPAPVYPYQGYNASQILDFTSGIFLTNMLKGDMNPQMFHQPDLHFSNNYSALTAAGPANQGTGTPFPPVPIPGLTPSSVGSLISDTYNLTFNKYKAVYKLPVLSPTLDQTALAMQSRNSYNLSGVSASLSGAPGSQTINITVTNPAVIPVTGLAVSGLPTQTALGQPGLELYGGQNISHIQFTTGGTQQYPVH